MNQREAFKETVELARVRGLPRDPGSSYGLDHLESMLSRIQDDFSEAKVGRWLGWAQCALTVSGLATLDEMKQLNLSHAGE